MAIPASTAAGPEAGARTLVYSTNAAPDFPESKVFVADIATAARTPLVAAVGPQWDPTVSPNGTHVAYIGGDSRGGVYVAQLPGGTQTVVAVDLFAPEVAWAPDGTALAVAGNGDVYVAESPAWALRRIGSGRRPVWSPDAAALGFTRTDDGFAHVHVARRDGTGVTRIGSGTTLAWSPDGAWIAVSGCSDDGGLCLLPAGGGDPTHLSPAWAAAASWSPDGTRLAFSTETETYVLTLSPRAVVRVGPDGATAPEWSPDGSAIAFRVLDQEVGGQSYVAVASPTRPDIRRVTPLADAVSAPSWMPDGRRVVYASRMNDNDFEIVLHDTASSTVTVLTDDPLEDVEPTWSPRGSRIAFVRGRRDADDFEFADGYHVLGSIYVMNADGTGVRRLTHRRHDHSPSWSPDGTRIVFEREGRLYIVNTFGTPRIRRLTALAETSRAPAWSPNGKLIAFERYYAEDDAYSIAVVSPDGGRPRRLTDADANDRAPSWAPDARSLAFQRDVITESDQLFTLRLRPRSAAPITTPTPCEDCYGFVTAASLPAWSRDGSRIAFVRATAVANPQIYSVSRAGRGERRMTTGPAAAMWPDWRPR